MRNSSPVAAVLFLQVAMPSDNENAAPVAGFEEPEMNRVLRHRLEIIESALLKIAELQCGTSHTPSD